MKKLLLPLIILLAAGGTSYYLYQHPPEATRTEPAQAAQIAVDTLRVQAQGYQVMLESYGKIRPRTQSNLLPQVGGQIVWVNPDFRNGSFFEKDELLLRIDSRDYEAQVATAQASLMSARQKLAEEQAQSRQASQDWQRLGNSNPAPPLVLRQPQLNAARADVASAEAALDIARLNLERTRIRAPYSGRILEKQVDLGQVVSSGTTLATLYAVDYVEVRLPLQNRDLKYIELPERYRFADTPAAPLPRVILTSELVGREEWHGQVVLTEGAIDDSSRQLYVVAQIDDPYGQQAAGRTPLKVGQYVTARIEGRWLEKAIVIPNRAIYRGSYVYTVLNGVLQRRDVTIAWQNSSEALISAGLRPGDRLVLTPLGQVTSGTPVQLRPAAESLAEQAGHGDKKAEGAQP